MVKDISINILYWEKPLKCSVILSSRIGKKIKGPKYKLFTIKLPLPAWGTLWTAVAMVTWRTAFDHILKKQVFTYRAQQDSNLNAVALGLYNKDRHAFFFHVMQEKLWCLSNHIWRTEKKNPLAKFLCSASEVFTNSLQQPHTNSHNSTV